MGDDGRARRRGRRGERRCRPGELGVGGRRGRGRCGGSRTHSHARGGTAASTPRVHFQDSDPPPRRKAYHSPQKTYPSRPPYSPCNISYPPSATASCCTRSRFQSTRRNSRGSPRLVSRSLSLVAVLQRLICFRTSIISRPGSIQPPVRITLPIISPAPSRSSVAGLHNYSREGSEFTSCALRVRKKLADAPILQLRLAFLFFSNDPAPGHAVCLKPVHVCPPMPEDHSARCIGPACPLHLSPRTPMI
ncbi:hypothetical protein BKA93DRAFT_108129 [Sparassis latifolia]